MPWQDKLLGSLTDNLTKQKQQSVDSSATEVATSYAICSTGGVPPIVCRSRRSHSVCLGTWSIIFLVVGITQLSAGIFFLRRLPATQLGTNFFAGAWNVVCCAAILVISFRCPEVRYFCCAARWPCSRKKSKLVLKGKEFSLLKIPEMSRVKWLLATGISALLANVINLIVLEVGEWRMAIANEEARFLGKKGFADTMFSAYVTATVATSTGVVAGFLCTQFVYCITSNRRHYDEERSVMSSNTQHQSIATISGKFDTTEMQERRRHSGRDSSQNWVYSDADDYRLTRIDDIKRVKAELPERSAAPDKVNRIATVRRTHSVFMSAPSDVIPKKVSRVQSFMVQPVTTPHVTTVQRSKTMHEGKTFKSDNLQSFDSGEQRTKVQTKAEVENQSTVKLIADDMERNPSPDDLSKPSPKNKFMKLSTKFGDGYTRDSKTRSVSSNSSTASFAKRYPYAKSIELINDKFPYGDSDADIDTTCDMDTTDAESCGDIADEKGSNLLRITKQRAMNHQNRRATTPDLRRVLTPDIDYDIKRSDTPISDSIKDIAVFGKKTDLLRVGNMLVTKADNKVMKEQMKVDNKDTVQLNVEAKVSEQKEVMKPVKPKRQCERRSSATQTDMSALRTRPRVAAAIKKVNPGDIPEKPQRPPPLPPKEEQLAEVPPPTNLANKTLAEQVRLSQSQSSSGYSSPQDSYEKSSPEPPSVQDTVCHVQDGSSVTVIKIESAKNSQRNATTLHITDSTKRKIEKPTRKKNRLELVDDKELNWSSQSESKIPKRSKSRLSMADHPDIIRSKYVGRSVSFNSGSTTDWMPLSATLLKEMQSTYLNGEEVPAVPDKPAPLKPNLKRSTSSVTLSDMYRNVPTPYFPYANLNLFRLQNLSASDSPSGWNDATDRRLKEGYERFKQGNYVVSDVEDQSGNVTELETIEETSLETSGNFSPTSEEHLTDQTNGYLQSGAKAPAPMQGPRIEDMPIFSSTFPLFENHGRFSTKDGNFPGANSSGPANAKPFVGRDAPFGSEQAGMQGYGFGNLPSFGYFGGLGGSPFAAGPGGGMNPNQAFAYFAELELMARHLRNQVLYQQAQLVQAQATAPQPKPVPKPLQREESFC